MMVHPFLLNYLTLKKQRICYRIQNPSDPASQEEFCLPPEETKCPLREDEEEVSDAWSLWSSSLWDTLEYTF